MSLCFGFGIGLPLKGPEDGLARLDEEVNLGIAAGWKPQGGICIAFSGPQGVASQAMVKEGAD